MQKVLIVEDDPDIAENIAAYLKSRDVSLDPVIERDGFSAFSRAATDDAVVLMLLDIGLPGLDGVSVCQRLREIGWVNPVIMLTARDTVEDKVRGLESGADDYLVKPFSLEELYARVRVQLRHGEKRSPLAVLKVADLSVNLQTLMAERAGKPLKLSNIVLKILIELMKRSPAVVTKDELMRAVWGQAVSAETVRTHMYMLRNAVDKPFEVPLVTTVPGIGWVLREPEKKDA